MILTRPLRPLVQTLKRASRNIKMLVAPPILETEALDLTLVGSFNPTIFQPHWFISQDLISKNEGETADIKVISHEVSDVRFNDVQLVCIPDRLTISTTNISYENKVHDFIDGILSRLPHTPVSACGINSTAHYSIWSELHWHKIGHILAPKELVWDQLYDEPGMESLTIKAPRLGRYPGAINVKVGPSVKFRPGLYVYVNWHFEVTEDPDVANSSIIRKFISTEWKEAVGEAKRVASMVFSEISSNE